MRKAKPKKRILLPDPKFGDVLVTRFVNNLMLDGKKSIAYNIFYDAVEIVGEKMKDADKAPLDIWKKALENITPCRRRYVPGADGGETRAQSFFGNEKPYPLLSQARGPLHG